MSVHDHLSREQKTALLKELLQRRATDQPRKEPLSYGQEALWFLHQQDPDSAAYNTAFTARIRSRLDVPALQRACRHLIDRHPILRTTYALEDGRPVQLVHSSFPAHFERLEIFTRSEDTLRQRVEEEYLRPFDLERGPTLRVHLFVLEEDHSILLLAIPHIARDGWSMKILIEELQHFYIAECGGRKAALPPLAHTYFDFAKTQKQAIAGAGGDSLLDYWKTVLPVGPPALDIRPDRPRVCTQTASGASIAFVVSESLTNSCRHLARESGVTLFTLLLSAFQLLLHQHSGQPEILVGTPTHGRDSNGRFDRVVGYFVNPVVLRASFPPGHSFREFLQEQRATVLGAMAHQGYPFSLLVQKLNVKRDTSRPLFQAMFNFVKVTRERSLESLMLPGADGGIAFGDLILEPFAIPQEEGQFDLGLEIVERSHHLHCALKYDANLFNAGTAARMAEQYQSLLQQGCRHPAPLLTEICPLTPRERHRQLFEWNATNEAYPRDKAIHQLVELEAERQPDVIAAVDSRGRITFGELNRKANQLAFRLQQTLRGPLVVGLYMEPSVNALIALLGILKAGAAYVPLDPSYPDDRLIYIASDAGMSTMLADREPPPGLSASVPAIQRLEWASLAECPAVNPVTPSECPSRPAYVIYTSGSTGKPKGVRIKHSSVVNFLASMQRAPGFDAHDVLLSVTSLSFDIVGLELLLPLVTGARVEIAGRNVAADPEQLKARLQMGDVTVMQATPTTWKMLIGAGWHGQRGLRVLCGGEALSRPLADALLERSDSVWNLYGPTETTIWSAVDRVRPGERTVPIGRPIANTQIYILNSALQPAPVGVPGDLYIGGDGLAMDYYNRPELTAEKFIPNPFQPATLIYQTGDRACYLEDGRVEFLERSDHQVKLYGHRIELGEVESVLIQHEAIKAAVVMKEEMEDGTARLAAYCVPAATDGEFPSETQLRNFLKRHVPAIMVPSVWISLPDLPLTLNGKIDRKALSAMRTRRPERANTFVPPRDALEEILADLWEETLHVDNVGIHDNFFELGGASMQCVRVSALAQRAGIQITHQDIFQYQTVAELAEALKLENRSVVDPLHHRLDIADVAPEVAAEHERLSRRFAAAAGQPLAQSAPAATAGVVIESLGVYIPAGSVSTRATLDGCRKPIDLDLEGLTGILSRPQAGPGEFSIDLAKAAVADCLSRSAYNPADIDLVICCNTSRYDSYQQVTFEPSTAVRLKKHFGFDRAVTFDLANACAGFFTGVKIADAFIRNGTARNAMLVSGEFVTHLTETAQKEIDGMLDPRLACLTVGDSGAAIILEASKDGLSGFHSLELFTLGRYSQLCIAKPTDREHGGAIMLTHSIEMTKVGSREGLPQTLDLLARSGLPIESFQHFIMHQTSSTTIRNAMEEINRLFHQTICHPGNTIDNLAHRGNTSTTTHFLALMDHVLSQRINSGDRILFAVSGSGITLGTALYTMDDLPDRIRSAPRQLGPRRVQGLPVRPRSGRRHPRARIERVGTIPRQSRMRLETVASLKGASEDCFRDAPAALAGVDLVIFCGVYGNDLVAEPAIGAMLVGELKLDAKLQESQADHRVFAFDICNGGIGVLNACHVANDLITAEQHHTALVAASEVASFLGDGGAGSLDIEEAASVLVLKRSEAAGFRGLFFKDFTDNQDACQVNLKLEPGTPRLHLDRRADLDELYLDAICLAVPEFLDRENIKLSDLNVILPPQFSRSFIARLHERLRIPKGICVDISHPSKDLFTSSLAYGLKHAWENGMVHTGDLGLFVAVGSGIQVGCAVYEF